MTVQKIDDFEVLGTLAENSYEAQRRDLREKQLKGTALQQMKQSQGYEILTATFEELRNKAVDALVEILPGDNERIIAAHAVAHSVTKTIDNVRDAIDGAINEAKAVPEQLEAIKLMEDLNPVQQSLF